MLKPWFYLAVIFLAGGVTGASLVVGLGPRFSHPPTDRQMRNTWMLNLTRRLNLTADQQAKIEPILTDAHRNEVEQISQIMKKANDQVAAVLTPDQQAELQKMQKEMEQNRDRMFPGPGHHHPWGPHDDMPHHGGPDSDLPPSPDAPTNSAPQGR
jgi:Spy/CpxP family protein refolding chaperone